MQEFNPPSKPVGWTAMRRDWQHFCRVRGATGLAGRWGVLASHPSLWALWIYRYGQWAYRVRVPVLKYAPRIVYQVLYLVGQHTAKIALDVTSDIGMDVWIAPTGVVLVATGSRVGDGTWLHGHNTLGHLAGTDEVPCVGRNVHVGPGTNMVGGVVVPDNTVIGPNSMVVRSLPESGAYTGAPAKPFDGKMESLIPIWAARLGS